MAIVSTTFMMRARDLEPDAIVDLFTLDTTMLTSVYGYQGQGDVYRWTPGALDYRINGIMGGQGASRTYVNLTPAIVFPNSKATYFFQAEMSDGSWCDPVKITNTATNADVTAVGLDGTGTPEAIAEGKAWQIVSSNSVWHGGIEYKSVPIQVEGMEWTGSGKAPRPKIGISNIGGLATALVVKFGDIVGAQVTRIRTFARFLDGEPEADPSAIAEPEIFTVDRKARHDKNAIEFELAPLLDQQGVRLPKRLAMRDTCDHTYRKWVTTTTGDRYIYGTCPYAAGSGYKADGTVATTPAQDVCGKHLSDCILRFGQNTPLPIRAFPGLLEGQF